MNLSGKLRAVAVLWVSLFWMTCVAVPVGWVFSRAVGFSHESLFDPGILSVLRFTVTQALWSTLISTVIGLPLGLWLGGAPSRFVRGLLLIPYGVPTVVVGMTITTWLGRSGILSHYLDWSYSLKAVVVAHVLLNAPWVALQVSQARSDVPGEQIEAARTLGAGAFERFFSVIHPYVKWSLATACAQVFGLCVMSFALILLLGGGPPVQSLETEIFARIRFSSLDMTGAVTCAFWELLVTLIPWTLVLTFQARQKKNAFVASKSKLKVEHVWKQRSRAAVCALFVLPYFTLFHAGTWKFFAALIQDESMRAPLVLSFELAITVGVFALLTAVAGVFASLKFESLALPLAMPSGLSVLVLGLGFFLAYGKWIDPFEGSFLAMVALQVTLIFPVLFRSLLPVASGTQKRLLEAAVTLGASPFEAFWWVEWPRWRRPLFSALAIAAGSSLGEVAAVSLFYSEKLIPLPLLVTRWMGQYHFEEAQALAALLFLLCAGLIGLVVWPSGSEGGECAEA